MQFHLQFPSIWKKISKFEYSLSRNISSVLGVDLWLCWTVNRAVPAVCVCLLLSFPLLFIDCLIGDKQQQVRGHKWEEKSRCGGHHPLKAFTEHFLIHNRRKLNRYISVCPIFVLKSNNNISFGPLHPSEHYASCSYRENWLTGN